jgi:hypothetical protein
MESAEQVGEICEVTDNLPLSILHLPLGQACPALMECSWHMHYLATSIHTQYTWKLHVFCIIG